MMWRSLAAVSVLALAACGGAGSSNAVAVSPVAAAPTASPSPTPSPSPTATATTAAIPAASYTPAAARVPTTGVTLRLGKCINLSNMLEAPNEGDWGRAFQDADMANIAGQGFTGIRIPVRFSSHAATVAPYAIDAGFMARVRHVVDLAVANHMAVILDMHHYLELFSDPAGQAPRFAALWQQVAAAFKDEPATVYFELINEPNTNLTAANLKAVLSPALAAVRATNPTRPVVIDGPDYAGWGSMTTSYLPDDPYIVPTFHYYDPANFGLDNASWLSPSSKNVYGSADDIAGLNKALAAVKTYIDTTGRVPFAGEYGAWEGRPDDQRAIYYATVSPAWASIGVQSCAWGYTNTYNLYRDATGWLLPAVNAIRTTTTLP